MDLDPAEKILSFAFTLVALNTAPPTTKGHN